MLSRTWRLTLATAAIASSALSTSLAAQANPYDDSLLSRVRLAARAIRGDLPTSVRYLVFAELQVPLQTAVSGSDSQLVTIAFPVFQLRFPNSWIVVDAGFDRATWNQFLPNEAPIYRQDRYDLAQTALRDAAAIVLTHEHWDHAAGIEHSPYSQQVTARALLTRPQLLSLLDPPAPYYVRISPDTARAIRTVDYDLLYSLAPGVVLIRAAGHSPGSQLIYVHLQSGQEFLLIGDLVWNMAGLRENRQRPVETSESLREDRQAVQQQIDWVRQVTAGGTIVAVPCHDSAWLATLTSQGLITDALDLTRR